MELTILTDVIPESPPDSREIISHDIRPEFVYSLERVSDVPKRLGHLFLPDGPMPVCQEPVLQRKTKSE